MGCPPPGEADMGGCWREEDEAKVSVEEGRTGGRWGGVLARRVCIEGLLMVFDGRTVDYARWHN